MSTATEPLAGKERRFHPGTVAVLVAGLLITSSLAVGAQRLHDSNEARLLRQRGREAGAVLTAAVPSTQTPLASAALVATVTQGNVATFRQLMTPLASSNGPFASISLWSLTGPQPRQLVVVGSRTELESEPAPTADGVLRASVGRATSTINNLLAAPERRLGYAYAAPGTTPSYVVYAESVLPKNRRAQIDKDSAFSDLDYALYLGHAPLARNLLASSTGGSVPQGRRTSVAVPFANSEILLVMTATRELGGNLMARLPWSFAAAGLLLTLAGAFLVERLLRRRDHAEVLAHENNELYKEQRSVAQSLQHSLLPTALPRVSGLEFASRYVAGVEGIDIGGDWYDVLNIDDDHVVFAVGDVSGRGLRAATTMAELRYAVRAYAAQGDPPEVILAKVARLISVVRDGHFATAVCGAVDVSGHQLTIANAGHPDPLLVTADDSRFLSAAVGPPLGATDAPAYRATTVSVPDHATLLAYTDGLVERRGETLDAGLDRLRSASADTSGTMEELLTRILRRAIPAGSADDAAILGLRWQN